MHVVCAGGLVRGALSSERASFQVPGHGMKALVPTPWSYGLWQFALFRGTDR